MRFWLKAIGVAALLAACVLLWPAPKARSATLSDMFGAYAGVNAAWLQGPDVAFPVDVEGSGNVKFSLSPHLSATGMLAYGFSHSYLRYDADARVTATDVNDPNFNLFLGIGYRGGSVAAFEPGEWAPNAGFGWRPSPESAPWLTIVGKSSVGLVSHNTITYLGGRYALPINPFK